MLKARWCLSLILAGLLLPCTLAQKKSQKVSKASLMLGLAALRNVENGTSAVVFSHSIVNALAMLLKGANGDTERQLLDKVFGTTSTNNVEKYQLRQSQTIGNYSETKINCADIVSFKKGEKLQIRVKGVADGKMEDTDNEYNNSKTTMQKLNRHVQQLTHGLINDAFKLEPQKSPLVLTNAVHFKALWQTTFYEHATKHKEFFVESNKCKVNGQNPKLPLMNNYLPVPYKNFPRLFDSKGIRLPFGDADNETSFYALLPGPSITVDKLLSALNDKVWKTIVRDLARVKIQTYMYDGEVFENPETIPVQIPAFNTTSTIPLKETLEKLGVTHMFNRGANFEKFEAGLFVEKINHKAFIKINEQGAEGAGLTQPVMADRIGGGFSFNANRPFVYVISNTRSGYVYFIGRFMGPNC